MLKSCAKHDIEKQTKIGLSMSCLTRSTKTGNSIELNRKLDRQKQETRSTKTGDSIDKNRRLDRQKQETRSTKTGELIMAELSRAHLMYALTDDQTNALTRHMLTQRTRDAALILSMLFCGLRNSEARQLRIYDIAVFEKIYHTITIRAEIAKNKRPREIPIPAIVRECYRSLVEGIEQYQWDTAAGEYAFPSRKKGGPLTARHVQRIVSRHTKQALGQSINPHALRHTYACRMLRVSDIRTVQYCLGHEDVRSTEIYTHPNMAGAAIAAEAAIPQFKLPEITPSIDKRQTLATRTRRIQDLIPTFGN